eukprot:590086_1
MELPGKSPACNVTPIRYTGFTIQALISLSTTWISLQALYRMIHHHKNTETFVAPIYFAQGLFYMTSALFGITMMPTIVSGCDVNSTEFHRVWFTIYMAAYLYHWVAFISLLFFRLKHVFVDTVFEISKCSNYTCIAILFYLFISPCAAIIAVIVYQPTIVQDLIGLNIGIQLILSQVLAFAFVRKLYKLNVNNSTGSTNELLMPTMTKYTILSIIPINATVILLFFMAWISVHELDSVSWLLGGIAFTSDVLIDVICITLSFTFNDKYYRKACAKCDHKCRSCCLLCAKQPTSQVETNVIRKMASVSSQSQTDAVSQETSVQIV